MNKKIYLVSLKLFALHVLFFSTAIGIYYLLVNLILNVEKLFDVLLITELFRIVVLTASFIFAVKIVKKKNDELFVKHRLILLFYAANIFLLLLIAFLLLIIFKDLYVGYFLLGSSFLLLYIYYYFSRLVYYIAFLGKLRRTAFVFAVILAAGYCLVLILPQRNYQKVYNEIEVKADFTYFHKLDLDDIAGKRDLKDKNSAKELTELIKLIATDEKLLDDGEVLSYILPTEDELQLLSNIVDNEYLSMSEEFLPEENKRTGIILIAPLNGLRAFSRGVVKLAKLKRTADFEDEAIDILNDLLFVGNQMINARKDTLVTRLVGQAMMEEAFNGLLQIYENDNSKTGMITSKLKELDNMRNGTRLMQTAVFHMNDEIVGSSKNTVIFFKHFAAQKDNSGSDFDERLLMNNKTFLSGYITIDATDLQKLVLSIITLPIIAPFKLNIGNNYIIYNETKKLSQEPGHELLKYYFENSYSDFVSKREENTEKAKLIYKDIFNN